MKWLIVITILIGLFVWAGVSEDEAESSALEFCDSVSEGSSFALLEEKAASVGSDSLRIIRQNSITVGFTGMTSLSRHLCEISAKDGKVSEKHYFYLD